MKKIGFAVFAIILISTLLSCATDTPVRQTHAPVRQTDAAIHQTDVPAATLAAQAAAPTTPAPAGQPVSPYFTGDGNRGVRLAVLVPDAVGLPAEQSYLPSLVQGVLVGDLSRFSAISVLDRMSLESVLAETESGIYQTEEDFGRLGEIANVDYVLTGSITRTATGHALQVQVVGTGRDNIGITRASFSGTPTVAEMDDFTGIRRASLQLLTGMGVSLTDRARRELGSSETRQVVSAHVALAHGITAQRQGTEVAALSYYFMAAAFDPSLLEAINRSSIMHASIRGGDIGDDVRSEIEWRRAWIERLEETERFFADFHGRESMPYTLFYTVELDQGAVNWQTETVNLSILTHLHGSGIWTLSIERAIQAVYDGLAATGRAQAWGLQNWPRQGVTNLNAFARRSNNFSVVFELLDDQNRVIGRQTLQAGGSWELSWAARPSISVDASVRRTLAFQNVDANAITDRMAIRVVSVNGIDAETAARNGILQVRAISRNELNTNDRFRFSRGVVQGFASHTAKVADLGIPGTIWGDPVVSISERAFEHAGLTSVSIPSSVTHIGSGAFLNNDNLTRVSIGANVTMSSNSFGGGGWTLFPENYEQNGRQAGTYHQSSFRFVRGEVQGFINTAARNREIIPIFVGRCLCCRRGSYLGKLVIPSTIWGNPVLSIGERAFASYSLHQITIPDSVTTIGGGAFYISGRIPSSPGYTRSVSSRIEITIGSNVDMGRPRTWGFEGEYGRRFVMAYNRRDMKAGTYTPALFGWSHRP